MRKLNRRNKLFLDVYFEHGFPVAIKAANYSKIHSYRILGDPKSKEYLVSLAKQMVDDLGLTYSGLINELLELARDVETPAKTRSDILKYVAETVKAAEEEQSDDTRAILPKLKPSKQVA